MPSKKENSGESADEQQIPTVNEDSSSLGEIKINLAVIQSIVKLAAKEVEGVIAVGKTGFVDEVTSFVTKKDSPSGIHVVEENGNYFITVRVVLSFGYELAKTAYNIQTAVRDQVSKMTNKQVAKVDVIIEEVRMEPTNTDEDEEDELGLAHHNAD